MQPRCGQCGRLYTKAQWRRQAFWCPICQKYVCSECLTDNTKCPVCGVKVGRIADEMFFLGMAFAIGFTLLFILPIIIIDKAPIFHPILIGFYIFVITSFFVGIAGFIQLKKQAQKHMNLLSTLPEGIIPIEKRFQFKNGPVEIGPVERSRRFIYPDIKGAFQDQLLNELDGQWDFPVISKEERIAGSVIVRKRMSRQFYVMISLGIFILVPCILWNLPYIIWIFGSTLLFFGILFLGVMYHSGKLVQKDDLIAQSKVAWKTIGFDATVRSLEEFLRVFPEDYKRETKDLPKGLLWKNPEIRYIFANGNFISSMYTENGSGNTFGWVAVGYTSKHYLHARDLQRNLDSFLSEKDLIHRD